TCVYLLFLGTRAAARTRRARKKAAAGERSAPATRRLKTDAGQAGEADSVLGISDVLAQRSVSNRRAAPGQAPSEPRREGAWELGQVVDRGIRNDVHRVLRRAADRATPHGPETAPFRVPG